MRRVILLSALALLSVSVGPLTRSAAAATTQEFRAELHDNLVCPAGVDLCGKGELKGFGTVTTTLKFTGFGPGPDGCAGLTAERVLTLDSDGSTLRLSLVGFLCPQGNSGGRAPGNGSGTFAVIAGTGSFADATGDGLLTVQATGKPGLSDTAKYEGTLTLH